MWPGWMLALCLLLAVALAGQPVALAGQPAALAGQPAALAGQPVALAGQPVALAGQPVASWPSGSLPCIAAFLRHQGWSAVEIVVNGYLSGE